MSPLRLWSCSGAPGGQRQVGRTCGGGAVPVCLSVSSLPLQHLTLYLRLA